MFGTFLDHIAAFPGLVERLHSVAQQLSTEPGMAQHGRALSDEVAQQMGYGWDVGCRW